MRTTRLRTGQASCLARSSGQAQREAMAELVVYDAGLEVTVPVRIESRPRVHAHAARGKSKTVSVERKRRTFQVATG